MAYKVGIANNNWSTAAVWDEVSNTPTSHASTNITLNATKYTAAFTAPVVDGVCAATGVALFGVTIPSSACTVTVTLQQNSAGWVDCAGPIAVSIDMATVYAAIGATLNNWLYFRVPVPFIFLSATAGYYRWAISYTGSNTTTLMADAAGTAPAYWSTHIIAVPAIPANTDLVMVPGQNATSVIKVSVDGTRTIGNLTNTAACTQMRPATASLWWDVQIGYGGEINFDNSASATLNCKGSVANGAGSTFRMDDKVGGPYSPGTGRIATLTFVPTASGNCGLGMFDKCTAVLQGEQKTSTTLWKTHPNVDWSAGWGVAANPAVVADVVGWAVNDEILIGPTGAYNHTEYKYIKTIGGGNSIVFSDTPGGAESGFTYAHTTYAWILNLTRNVVINTNNAALGFYVYGFNTLTTGGIDIDWTRFENVGANASNKYGIQYEANILAFANLDYSLCYNIVDGGYGYFTNAARIPGTYNGLIACKYTGGPIDSGFYHGTTKNKVFNNCFGINQYRSGLNLNNCATIEYNDCYYIANNASGNSSYGNIASISGNITFNNCESHLARLYGINFTGNNADITLNNIIMGTKGANGTADIQVATGSYLSNVIFENPTLNNALPNNYNNMAVGSQFNINKLSGTEMKHYFYRATGIGQTTGVGLADTKVRTAGSYGLLISPDATTGTSGMKKTFYVLARPSSQVVVYGYLWRNAPACTINLYLPGSITPDAMQTFGAAIDSAWQPWIVSANYTGILPKLAKVEIIVTGTSGGVYFDDIYNGTNLLGALDTWNNGDIVPIIYDELGDAGAVWANILSNGQSADATLTGVKSRLYINP